MEIKLDAGLVIGVVKQQTKIVILLSPRSRDCSLSHLRPIVSL
jgi:hypothetical protein